MQNEDMKKGSLKPCVKVVDLDYLLAKGWSYESLIDYFIRLDHSTISGMDDETEGTSEQWLPVLKKFKDCIRVLVCEQDSIVGYWHFVLMEKEFYEKFKGGNLPESEIRAHLLPEISTNSPLYIYLVMLTIKPDYRTKENLHKLLKSFFEQLEKLLSSKVLIKELCGDAFTPEGTRICDYLGLKPYKKGERNIHTGTIEAVLNSKAKITLDSVKNSFDRSCFKV